MRVEKLPAVRTGRCRRHLSFSPSELGPSLLEFGTVLPFLEASQPAAEPRRLHVWPPATLHRPPPWHPPGRIAVAPPPQRYVPLRRTRATTCGSHTPALGDLHAHPGVLVPRELGAPAGLFSEISDLNSDFEDRNAFGAIIRANCRAPLTRCTASLRRVCVLRLIFAR